MLERLLTERAAFFSKFGLTPSAHPMEVVMAIEYEETVARYQGYGYLYGYPDYAVDYFAEAEASRARTEEREDRDFFSVPTYARPEGAYAGAVPKGHVESDADRKILEKARAVLEEYRRRRERYIGEGKPGVVELLRDWYDDGNGRCDPALRGAPGGKISAVTIEETLADWTIDARKRTFDLVEDLDDPQLMGPRLAIVNPLLWEIGHVAWFQEKWVLRHALKEPPILEHGDLLYDSSAVPHDVRWDLPLPRREETLAYMSEVRDRVLDRLARPEPDPRFLYFAQYAIHHEDMHDEAFTYTRQTLAYPAPRTTETPMLGSGGSLPGDVEVPGGRRILGATEEEPFVFDNEKWAHPVEVPAFAIARAPVTQAEFARFIEEGGYRRMELWDEEGWAWRSSVSAEGPLYWRRAGTGWERRDFDRFVPLEPNRPVLHVNWHEARAYCRWAGRRLPSEAEWETAAALAPGGGKRRFPWGAEPPGNEPARLDARSLGCADVAAHPEGDSPAGCRQMIGNVWEWCQDSFHPYPGFVADAYHDYSKPWFGTHRVLRGGCWVTRSRLIRNTWRNFYPPDRRDVWAGFRTCALR